MEQTKSQEKRRMRQCRALVNTIPHKPPHMVWKQQVSLVPCMRVCAQACWILWDSMDCSLPGSSVYAFPQNRCSSRTSLAWPAAKCRSPGSPVCHTTVCYKPLTGSRYSVKIVEGRNRRREGGENTHFQIFLTPHPQFWAYFRDHYSSSLWRSSHEPLSARLPLQRSPGHSPAHLLPDGPDSWSLHPTLPLVFLYRCPWPSTGERETKMLEPP